MYTQFFGNYLFSKGYVTKDELLQAMIEQPRSVMHLSTLALYSGYMSAKEIEYVIHLQDEHGKKFSELAMLYGFLTKDQVYELLNTTVPDFLILGQILIGKGVFSYSEFENILTDYRSQNEFLDLELDDEKRNDFHTLIEGFSILSESAIPDFGKSYLELFYKNLVRYIGEDFSSLPPSVCKEFATEYCVSQQILGPYSINTYLNMDESTALCFAERYSGEQYREVDEYVLASIEDILNLHNGLFIVNASNERSIELSIGIIEHHSNTILDLNNPSFLFPIAYPFGIIYYIMEIVSLD